MSKSDPTDNVLAAIASIFDQTAHHREPEKPAVEEKPAAPEMVEAGGYQKVGPGPIAAIRFVDDREREARERFEQLKNEMAGRGAAAKLVRKDAGEM